MDIQKEKKAIKNLKAFYMEDWNLTEEERDDLDNLVSRIVAVVKTEAQAVPETQQALNDRLLVKSIREHVESHIAEIRVNDLFDKGWLAAMKCIQNNIDMLKAQAVPEGYVLVKKVHPDAIVHNQGLGLFKECQVIYGWDGKSKDFKEALNKGFYHGVKLGAKAVLETAMIEAQEPAND